MASDLIYREDAKDFVRHAYNKGLNPVKYLGEVPAADVRPVVKNAYDEIGSIVESWCKKHAYQTMVVTIAMKYDREERPCIFSEVMEFDCDTCSFIWRSDWWEGQQIVKLIGFRPLSDIMLVGKPPEANIQ